MADRYWIAATAGDWNNTANWSATSGGAGGASVPGASDAAIFDANGSGGCTLDLSPSITTLTISGYGGTLAGSTFDFSVSGNFTASGGTLDFGSGTWTVGGLIDIASASGITGGSATLKMTGSGISNLRLGNSSGKLVDTFEVATGASATTVYYSHCNNLVVNGTLTTTGAAEWWVYKKTTVAGTLSGGAAHSTVDLEIQSGGTVSKTGVIYPRKITTASTNPVLINNGTCSSDIHLKPIGGGSVATFTVALASDFAFDGNFVFPASLYTGTITFSPSNYNLTFRGDVVHSGTTTLLSWSAGTGTITLDNTAAQAINFNGETVEAVVVSDASTGAITLGASFTTPYVHDCNSLINLNGFTITETGTDPNPCSSNTYFFPANFGGRL